MVTFDLNWVAVVVAAVASMVIGFVWYHPKVFGERWAASSGRSIGDMTMAPANYAILAITSLVSAWAVALVVLATGAADVVDGVIVGVIGWLGFSATVSFSDRLFNGGSIEFFTIQTAYRLVSFAVMGAILAAL